MNNQGYYQRYVRANFPPPVAERMIVNHIAQDRIDIYWDDSCRSRCIMTSLHWSETPEDSSYWGDLYNFYMGQEANHDIS